MVTGVDLRDGYVQSKALAYLRQWQVLVVVMAPTCTPYGPWARFNSIVNHGAWLESHRDAQPVAWSCGKVALIQLTEGRYFLNEQPTGSLLYEEDPWPLALRHPSVVSVRFDQCMAGLTAINGLKVKKNTTLYA